jgi:molybdenum cofactor cytidylyltransferase
VIVLASGRGERFIASGGTVHKLKAPLAGKPLLEHTIDAVRASGLPMHLVNGGFAGMGDSIADGVRATCGACGWLVLPGDLPLICASTLLTIAAELESCSVVVPVFQGQKGHPVGFAAICRDDLLCLQGDTGAASIVKKYAPKLLPVDDIGAIHDVDTVTDLAFAEQIFLMRAAD